MANEHKRFAVVIGISTYDDDIGELPCAKNDAYRLQAVLRQSAGFDADHVYLLANGFDEAHEIKADAPTRSNILKRVKYVCETAGPEDLILLYFAGHGVEISKTPYLITSDTMMDVLGQTGLNVNELNGMLEESGCQCVVRVFDACRSSFAHGRGVSDRMTDGLHSAVMKCATGWASFSSCSSGEVARESGELNQGVFTYYLCLGLSGKARNQQGIITIEGLVDYVKTSVGNWCDIQSLRQTPHFQSDLSGSLVFGTFQPEPAEVPILVGSPFCDLIAGIEQHLTSTASDARRLTFTSDDEWNTVADVLYQQLGTKLDELSHPAFTTKLGKMQPLQNCGNQVWQRFNGDIASCSLQGEFTGKSAASNVVFGSTEVVVPSTVLHVAIVKFNFFYWLWYCHVCQPQQLQDKFKPDPPYTKGFFTFKPSGARDADKTGQALTELLTRSSSEIVTWAKQLGAYVESRVDPLRKVGPIIE